MIALCGAANAAEPKAKGVYLGAGAGTSLFDDDGAIGGVFNDQDKSLQTFGGYKFFKYLSIEARYADFGSFSDGVDSLETTSASANVVGIIPFGTSGWELFGQLGLGQIDIAASNACEKMRSAPILSKEHLEQLWSDAPDDAEGALRSEDLEAA